MSLVYTDRVDQLEIGLNAVNNVNITNVVLINWERIHDIRPRLTANTKIPVGWQQPHSWIIGSVSLLSDNNDAFYATIVDAGGNFALDADGDSATIGFFMVTYRDSNNNVRTTTFNNAIISRPVKELLNFDDSVWIYNFLAYFADDAAV